MQTSSQQNYLENTAPFLSDNEYSELPDQSLGEQSITGADRRAAHAANRLGIETEEVEQLPFDLSVLEEEGLFLNVEAD